jgi:5-methylcytosine-specific restriction endonuclease McrA
MAQTKEDKLAYRREWYRKRCEKDPSYVKSIVATNKRNRIKRDPVRTEELSFFYEKGCLKCSETDLSCLDAHHVDPKQKEHSIGTIKSLGYSLEKIKQELAKCVCLCANCHRKLHAGKIFLLQVRILGAEQRRNGISGLIPKLRSALTVCPS